MAHAAQIPTSFGHELRACLRCRLIKTYDQFRESSCENCPFFKMDEDRERVVDCTTANFTGLISVMDPTRSWAARWLRIGRFRLGCYTLAVSDTLTEDLQSAVPSTWDPSAIASIGGQDMVLVRQDKSSNLEASQLKKNLDQLGDQLFTGDCTFTPKYQKHKGMMRCGVNIHKPSFHVNTSVTSK